MTKAAMVSVLRTVLGDRSLQYLRGLYQGVAVRSSRQNLLVPRYIYSARVKEEDVEWFENQFYRNVDLYDPEVRDTEERFSYALRIGYTFLADLKARISDQSAGHQTLKTQLTTLGNAGFDWTYYAQPLSEGACVYAFGVGTDISWEVGLANRHGCVVKCFDPTPQAIDYARGIEEQESLIEFYPIGVFSKDTEVEFFKPKEKGLGSHSMVNLRQSEVSIQVPVRTLSSIMKDHGDDRIDMLKMDIEGAEYSVLENLEEGMEIDQIAVEFDQPVPPWRTERVIRDLLGMGYQLVHVDGLNCLFVHARLLK